MFDVAIVNYNTDCFLHNLLVSLRDVMRRGALQTVRVWDNGSTDDSLRVLGAFQREVDWLDVHASSTNIHHGPALDALLRQPGSANWTLVLDSDTELTRDFVDAVGPSLTGDPAFVGQIQPEAPPLYAYLAHLLVNRSWYVRLPPFSADGAPGLGFFGAIAAERIPYARFRWADYVRHFGQATLRGLVEREEHRHPLYGFAAAEAHRAPKSTARVQDEQRMQHAMSGFLDGVDAPARTATVLRTARARAPGSRRRQIIRGMSPWAWRRPRTALALRRARRMGLVQKAGEIRRLLALLGGEPPRRVLEIGTAHGGTFYLWTRSAANDGLLISVDRPPWEPDDPLEPARVRALVDMARPAQSAHSIRGDSHAPETAARVRTLLQGERLDFLFIDGDHSYAGVRRDFEMYSPLVRRGGIVALHDIQPHPEGWGGEVPVFWNEVKRGFRHQELIDDPRQKGFGIGVLWMP